ncbi:hypothetical protein C1645_813884 [Glomus cerebriforme]|uniref:Uncharacterized protein n=1 Tax=Glomus cerebriforme TaxID=658196 RepID=A0A397TI78_9GLOM|nr:hypothetical protein C1645_813884 [Glomus cerebriforme]
MFLLSNNIKNISFRLSNKITQNFYDFLFRLQYKMKFCSLQKLDYLENILSAQRKEKAIRQAFNLKQVIKTAQKLAKAGERDDIVTDLISAFHENEAIKSFSSIEVDDISSLLKYQKIKSLYFKDNIALEPSKLFKDIMDRIFRCWNLSLENARKTMVDTYLLEAVDYDYNKQTYDIEKDKLSIYPEYYIKPMNINSNLILKGSINYLSAKRFEDTNVSLNIGISKPSHCMFCAVEAKKDESFSYSSGELLGQMKMLNYKERKPINGVLTDGIRWMFFHVSDDKTFYESMLYNHRLDCNLILGILYYWVRGEIPSDCLSKIAKSV